MQSNLLCGVVPFFLCGCITESEQHWLRNYDLIVRMPRTVKMAVSTPSSSQRPWTRLHTRPPPSLLPPPSTKTTICHHGMTMARNVKMNAQALMYRPLDRLFSFFKRYTNSCLVYLWKLYRQIYYTGTVFCDCNFKRD